MTNTAAAGGAGSPVRMRLLRMRGRYVAGKTHTMRARITVRHTATAIPTSHAGSSDERLSSTTGSCRPMSMNTKLSMRKMRMVQTPPPMSRPSGDSTRAARRPAMSPATTVARTPLTPRPSAMR